MRFYKIYCVFVQKSPEPLPRKNTTNDDFLHA